MVLGSTQETLLEHSAAIVRALEAKKVTDTAVKVLKGSQEAVVKHGMVFVKMLEAVIEHLFGELIDDGQEAAVDVLRSSPEVVTKYSAAIAERLDHVLWKVREGAIRVLGASHEAVTTHGAAIVERLFNDKENHVRVAAAEALGSSQEALVEHGPAIAPRLEDEKPDVRKAAVEALWKWPELVAQTIPEIIAHVRHKDSRVANLAQTVVSHVEPMTLAKQLHGRGDVFVKLGQVDDLAELLRRTIAVDPSLGDLRNDNGDLYIDLATLQCRHKMYAALYLLGRFEVDAEPPLHVSATAVVFAATDHREDQLEEQNQGKAVKKSRRALKAMREARQVLAELNGRKDLDREFVVTIVAVYVDASVDHLEEIREAATELDGVSVTQSDDLAVRLEVELERRITLGGTSLEETTAAASSSQRTKNYKYLLVLDLAERSLTTTLTHDHIAGENFPLIRNIATDIAKALSHLHKCGGRIHGDLKPLNTMRIDSTWRIIDMDASCSVGEPFGEKAPSSGYSPPEMAKVLLKNDLRALAEYKGNVAYDLWSFGCVLFHLVFGKSLWHTDKNDNITRSDLEKLACVSGEGDLRRFLTSTLLPEECDASDDDRKTAVSLLSKLLEPDETKRIDNFMNVQSQPTSPTLRGINERTDRMEKEQIKQTAVLEAIDDRTHQIKHLQHDTIDALNKHAQTLRRCIQAAADDEVPTAFVILAQPPGEELSDESTLLGQAKEQLNIDETTEDVDAGSDFGDSAPDQALKAGCRLLELYRRGKEMYDSSKAAFKDPKQFLIEKLEDQMTTKVYLSLVCELCWTAQPDAYEVTKPTDWCRKVLPIAGATLSTILALNGVAGIAQCFFPGVPVLSNTATDAAKKTLKHFREESSVSEFERMQTVLETEAGEQGKQHGYCLREFKNFLQEVDEKHVWAKLKRILLGDGKSVWVCSKCLNVLNRHSKQASLNRALLPGEHRDDASNDIKTAAGRLHQFLERDEKTFIEYFDPKERSVGLAMEKVLEEPFFHFQTLDEATLRGIDERTERMEKEQKKQNALLEAIDDRTFKMKSLQHDTIERLNEHAKSLRDCIRAAVDDKVPTAFVILSQPPGEELFDKSSLLSQAKHQLEAKLDETEDAVVEAGSDLGDSTPERVLKAGCRVLELYRRCKEMYDSSKVAFDDPTKLLRDTLKYQMTDTFYLSLVCELCWTAQPDAYKVTKPTEWCRKVLPIAGATLSTILALNGVAGLAQCFFPGIRVLSKAATDSAKMTIKQYGEESSVSEFDEVQKVLEREAGEQSKQDGYCLRQFKNFLEEADEKHVWAKLTRMLLGDGKSAWVCPDCLNVLNRHRDASYDELHGRCLKAKMKTTSSTMKKSTETQQRLPVGSATCAVRGR